MSFGPNRELIQNNDIYIDSNPIERVDDMKFLGVVIDKNLNWKSHIDSLNQVLSRNYGIIFKLSNV